MGLGNKKTKLDQDTLTGKGNELFRKTEVEESQTGQEHGQAQGVGATPVVEPKERERVKKSLYLDAAVSERLRQFCFDKRRKENHVVVEALMTFLEREGY